MDALVDVEKLFKDSVEPGIYSLDIQAPTHILSKLAETYSFALFYINGNHITNKTSFLKVFASSMGFPKYFGQNWDAFEECITDLRWCPASGYVILYNYSNVFAQHDVSQFDIAVDILKSAIDYWKKKNIPMFVLLENAYTHLK